MNDDSSLGRSAGGASDAVADTGAQFYRELRARGLHLRHENGRDNALLDALRSRLGLGGDSFERALESRQVSSEAFLEAFLEVTSPFATMFQEIWEYLAAVAAPSAAERVRVRFGFREEGGVDVDLEQFREWEERCRAIHARTTAWTPAARRELFSVSSVFQPFLSAHPPRSQHWAYYTIGRPLTLPQAPVGSDEFAAIARRVHSMLSAAIGEGVRLHGRTGIETPEYASWKKDWGYPLTDTIPPWEQLFERFEELPPELQSKAVQVFEQCVAPLLASSSRTAQEHYREALDVLALPFWRHRWHTYEIWATIVVIRALDAFRPSPVVRDGRIPLDGYDSACVAHLLTHERPSACVVAQLETPFARGKRKAIKPDLSICFDETGSADSRAAVVEMKQRIDLDPAHAREVVTSYRDGSPRASRVILVNYDGGAAIEPIDRVEIIHRVHPGMPKNVARFEESVREACAEAQITPDGSRLLVLMDVSGSMAAIYQDASIKRVLEEMIRWNVTVRSFNDDVQGAPNLVEIANGLRTGGGTNLRAALERTRDIRADRIWVVSDGGFEAPVDELQKIRPFRVIAPREFPRAGWHPTLNGALGEDAR